MTELFLWNGSAFVLDTNYRTNILFVADGTTHATSTLTSLFDGSETVTAQVQANNTNVVFTYPSPSVNYVQYDGTALSGLLNDPVSYFFWFRPNLVAAVSANQSNTFARPVELITLSLTGAVAAPFLSVSPAGNFSSSGKVGGPFSPASQIYTLNNNGSGSLNWAASNTASWLTL